MPLPTPDPSAGRQENERFAGSVRADIASLPTTPALSDPTSEAMQTALTAPLGATDPGIGAALLGRIVRAWWRNRHC